MRYDYDMLGNRIHQAAWRRASAGCSNDVAGKPIRAWDSRALPAPHDLRRAAPADRAVRHRRDGAERLAVRTVYGEGQGDAANLRGRVYQVFDDAGVVTSVAYDFKGNLLREPARPASRLSSPADRTGC